MNQSVDTPNDAQRCGPVVLVLATILGVAGLGLLILTTVQLIYVGCPMSFIPIIFWAGLGLVVLFIDAAVLMAIGLTSRRWNRVGLALVVIGFAVAFFFFVAIPWTSELRIARHHKLMSNTGVPILQAMVVTVEEARAQTDTIPADESEFHSVIADQDLQRLENLRCCWVITYKKLDSQDYQLRYIAMDVEYVYESRRAAFGWHAVEPGH